MYGVSCYGGDIVAGDILLPEVNVGDWIYWPGKLIDLETLFGDHEVISERPRSFYKFGSKV